MEDRVRVSVPLHDGAPGESESLWARPLGDGRFLIDNIPFSAYNINLGDVVIAYDASIGLMVDSIAERGGHRTFRVLRLPGTDPASSDALLARLEALGCGVETATERWIAIDAPPDVDRSEVEHVLADGWSKRVWQYESADEGPPG